jgi:phosphotransferase system HPr-like phosphotransfer protein
MKEVLIKLSANDDIKELVKITNKYDYDIDLKSGRYVIDAKSILGFFCLDLSKPVQVNIHCDECEELMKDLEPYKA